MKKYLITLNGHGVETAFLRLTPELYSFWFQKSQDENFEICDYLFSPEEFEDDIPQDMNFLIQNGESLNWDDNELVEYLETTPNMDTCFINIQNEEGDDIVNEPFQEYNEAYDCIEYGNSITGSNQLMEINSYEKGTIFGGYFETDNFDPSKLKFHTTESPNGNDYLVGVFYDGEEIINTEYSTRGKGIEVEVWEK